MNTNRKDVKFSVLAGNPLPMMCKTVVSNDGVVPVESAVWQIRDNALSKNVHTDLTGTEDFSSFVKKRLAVGPKGNHNPEAPESAQSSHGLNRNFQTLPAAVFLNAAYAPRVATVASIAADDAFRPAFAKELKLAPGQAMEVEIPVAAAINFGVTFMADANVSAMLVDDKGVLRGKNLAGSPEARGFFRTIFIDSAVGAGIWKLKLENTGKLEAAAVISAWSDAASKKF